MPARLFVAVTPPAAAVEHLDAVVAPLREQHERLRWTRSPMWHLTCAFLGDVAEERVPELESRLARVARRHGASELRFAGAGAFARPARANVLFTRVEPGPLAPASQSGLGSLAKLAASCAAAGRRIGLAIDDRPYRPHLTLARVKGAAPIDVRPLMKELGGYEGPAWTAAEISLIRSYLGANPHYETLARWPLAG